MEEGTFKLKDGYVLTAQQTAEQKANYISGYQYYQHFVDLLRAHALTLCRALKAKAQLKISNSLKSTISYSITRTVKNKRSGAGLIPAGLITGFLGRGFNPRGFNNRIFGRGFNKGIFGTRV